MKVMLIIPNQSCSLGYGNSDPPIGVLSIAGHLETLGFTVEVLDAMAEQLSEDEILARAIDFQAPYIGLSCNYCTLHNPTIRLAKRLKRELGFPATVFVGGNHATALSSVMLAEAGYGIDCIARGEGETVTPILIEAREAGEPWRKIPGISYRENRRVVHNPALPLEPDLDRFGMPAYHLAKMNLYKRYNLVSMRGCPYACDFCASTVLFTRKVRYRSEGSILKEVGLLRKRYGDRHFWFSDDSFLANQQRSIRLLHAMIEQKADFRWSCLTTACGTSSGLLELMKKAGCAYISYGVETGCAENFQYLGKPLSCQHVIEVSRLTHSIGIPHYAFFIFGFPGETRSSVQDTYSLIQKCQFDGGGMNILIPLPGTRLWDLLYHQKKHFEISEIQWDHLFAVTPEGVTDPFAASLASRWCNLSTEELLEACRLGRQLIRDSAQAKVAVEQSESSSSS